MLLSSYICIKYGGTNSTAKGEIIFSPEVFFFFLTKISESWGSHPNKGLCGQNVSVTEMKKLFGAISGSLKKGQAEQVSDCSHSWNHFALPKCPFELQVWQMCKFQHNPDMWCVLYEAVSTICKVGMNGSLVGRAIFKVMVASTSKFMSMHGLCYRWEGCNLLKWESYMHMDQVVIQKITVNDHE